MAVSERMDRPRLVWTTTPVALMSGWRLGSDSSPEDFRGLVEYPGGRNGPPRVALFRCQEDRLALPVDCRPHRFQHQDAGVRLEPRLRAVLFQDFVDGRELL